MLANNTNGLNIPDEFIKIIDKTGYGKSLDEKFRLSLAIGLFIAKKVGKVEKIKPFIEVL